MIGGANTCCEGDDVDNRYELLTRIVRSSHMYPPATGHELLVGPSVRTKRRQSKEMGEVNQDRQSPTRTIECRQLFSGSV